MPHLCACRPSTGRVPVPGLQADETQRVNLTFEKGPFSTTGQYGSTSLLRHICHTGRRHLHSPVQQHVSEPVCGFVFDMKVSTDQRLSVFRDSQQKPHSAGFGGKRSKMVGNEVSRRYSCNKPHRSTDNFIERYDFWPTQQ